MIMNIVKVWLMARLEYHEEVRPWEEAIAS